MIAWRDKVSIWNIFCFFRSLAVLAWGLLRFPWNWRACCSTLTPSLSITRLGRGVCILSPFVCLSMCYLFVLQVLPCFCFKSFFFSPQCICIQVSSRLIWLPYVYYLGQFLMSDSEYQLGFCFSVDVCLSSEQCGPNRSEEDSMLWHWCGGGWPSEGPNEQFSVLYDQPAGDCCTGDEGNPSWRWSITNACTSLACRIMFKMSYLLLCWLHSLQIHETIEYINQLKTERDFMLSFSNNPQDFIQDWLKSQSRDLKVNIWSCHSLSVPVSSPNLYRMSKYVYRYDNPIKYLFICTGFVQSVFYFLKFKFNSSS